MLQRIIFGALYAIGAILLFLFGTPEVVCIVVGLMVLGGLYEFFNAVGFLKNKKIPVVISTVFSVAMMIAVYVTGGWSSAWISAILWYYIAIMTVYMVTVFNSVTFTDVAVAVVGTCYVTLFPMNIYLLRLDENYGKLYIWLPFIIAWLTDTMAYFSGRFFGKNKLIPDVSPKKTVEGAVGGILGAVLIMVVYLFICEKYFGIFPKYINGIVSAVILSFFAQFGDLVASCIKREHGIKDFGSLVPGHGGILDRFDSVIFIAPMVYILVQCGLIF